MIKQFKKNIAKRGQSLDFLYTTLPIIYIYKNIDLSTDLGILNLSNKVTIKKISDNKYNIDCIFFGEKIIYEKLELEEVKDFLKTEFELDKNKIEEILSGSQLINIEFDLNEKEIKIMLEE